MERRTFIKLAASGVSAVALTKLSQPSLTMAAERIEKRVRSNAEWKRLLTSAQYHILREEGTERPYTSPLNRERRSGLYLCVACDLPLFPSRFKFESGTGWPSFYDVLPGHVETEVDRQLVLPRTEYHCARCGGPHGHVFDDGPKPTDCGTATTVSR